MDGAGGGCGGCCAAGTVILEGGLTVGLAVLQTLGCEVMNHGGLGRDVVVVVAAANVFRRDRFNEDGKIGERCEGSTFIEKQRIGELVYELIGIED